tara:strand:+ start:1409 stop:1702 length:294 start_codon:yes stop_codon:yes gene_type:complete
MDFTAENNFFEDDELKFDLYRKGRPSVVDWEGVVESGKWFFLPNSKRSENAVLNDDRPNAPTRYTYNGYKFSMKKTVNPFTGEEGLGIKCILYPDNV